MQPINSITQSLRSFATFAGGQTASLFQRALATLSPLAASLVGRVKSNPHAAILYCVIFAGAAAFTLIRFKTKEEAPKPQPKLDNDPRESARVSSTIPLLEEPGPKPVRESLDSPREQPAEEPPEARRSLVNPRASIDFLARWASVDEEYSSIARLLNYEQLMRECPAKDRPQFDLEVLRCVGALVMQLRDPREVTSFLGGIVDLPFAIDSETTEEMNKLLTGFKLLIEGLQTSAGEQSLSDLNELNPKARFEIVEKLLSVWLKELNPSFRRALVSCYLTDSALLNRGFEGLKSCCVFLRAAEAAESAGASQNQYFTEIRKALLDQYVERIKALSNAKRAELLEKHLEEEDSWISEIRGHISDALMAKLLDEGKNLSSVDLVRRINQLEPFVSPVLQVDIDRAIAGRIKEENFDSGYLLKRLEWYAGKIKKEEGSPDMKGIFIQFFDSFPVRFSRVSASSSEPLLEETYNKLKQINM